MRIMKSEHPRPETAPLLARFALRFSPSHCLATRLTAFVDECCRAGIPRLPRCYRARRLARMSSARLTPAGIHLAT
jgi:hypothetical protein